MCCFLFCTGHLTKWEEILLARPWNIDVLMMIAPMGKEVVCAPFKCRESHLRHTARISITSKMERILLWAPIPAEKGSLLNLWDLSGTAFTISSTGLITIEVWKASPDCWPMRSLHQQFLQVPFRAFESCGHQWDSHSHGIPYKQIKYPSYRVSHYIKQDVRDCYRRVMDGTTGCPGSMFDPWLLQNSIFYHPSKSEILLLWLCINHSQTWREKKHSMR